MAKGFSLIELLVAMTVMSIVLGATVSFFVLENRNSQVQEQRLEMIQKAQSTLGHVVDNLRMIGYDPHELGDFTISSAESTRLGYTAPVLDSTGDPMIDTVTGNPVVVAMNWAVLNDTLTRSGQVISTDVERILFQYLNEVGDTLSFPINGARLDSIHNVAVTLTFRNRMPRYRDFRYTVRGYVQLRNR
ncbi:hypothetical protein AMJ40_01215 [candidate division TA06 bacterium DG_26]|uniref:Type II secretion system protein J n=1 Tax=candidate division TA06 bacterium DG_26 TaxID=1703771 RepID=A0A0S7WLI3_UNCT6|nr:MAG: hypothetical protein AMJ40_01215 [candidate division TA06 bacterium DG_26]